MDEKSNERGLTDKERQRLEQIIAELGEGTAELRDIGPAVTIFGSARSASDSWEYQSACELAELLSREGVAIITGGGPGVMEASNRGATGEKGISVGLNIDLPHEQEANPYLDIDLDFRFFFTRKFLLMRYSMGFAVYPGGFGTA